MPKPTIRLDSRDTKTFPWYRCKPGESFFVPTLEPQKIALLGIQEGRRQLGRLTPLRYKMGVYNKLLGVMFTVPRHRNAPAPAVQPSHTAAPPSPEPPESA